MKPATRSLLSQALLLALAALAADACLAQSGTRKGVALATATAGVAIAAGEKSATVDPRPARAVPSDERPKPGKSGKPIPADPVRKARVGSLDLQLPQMQPEVDDGSGDTDLGGVPIPTTLVELYADLSGALEQTVVSSEDGSIEFMVPPFTKYTVHVDGKSSGLIVVGEIGAIHGQVMRAGNGDVYFNPAATSE
jgi:hypothetical protein